MRNDNLPLTKKRLLKMTNSLKGGVKAQKKTKAPTKAARTLVKNTIKARNAETSDNIINIPLNQLMRLRRNRRIVNNQKKNDIEEKKQSYNRESLIKPSFENNMSLKESYVKYSNTKIDPTDPLNPSKNIIQKSEPTVEKRVSTLNDSNVRIEDINISTRGSPTTDLRKTRGYSNTVTGIAGGKKKNKTQKKRKYKKRSKFTYRR